MSIYNIYIFYTILARFTKSYLFLPQVTQVTGFEISNFKQKVLAEFQKVRVGILKVQVSSQLIIIIYHASG